MVVCPSCQEPITSEDLKGGRACPFCHEPLPENLLAELAGQPLGTAGARASVPGALPAQSTGVAPAAPAAAAGPATGAPASAAGVGPSSGMEEEPAGLGRPKGRKTWIYGLVLLLVAGGGLAYWYSKRGETGAGPRTIQVEVAGQKYALKGFDAEDYARLLEWRRKVRDAVVSYLADRCDPYRRHGFQIASRLVEREVFVTPTKKMKNLQLDVRLAGRGSEPADGFDWMRCPAEMASLHKEHIVTITMRFEEKERVLGPTLRLATVTIGGGRFVQDKGTYRSPWDQRREGIFFPKFRKLAKDHPSVAIFSGKAMRRQDRKHMTFGGLPFERVERLPGKSYVVGVWMAQVASDRFVKVFRAWTGGCPSLEKKLREIGQAYPDKEFRLPVLKEQALELGRRLCKGMRALAEGLSPWTPGKVRAGRSTLAGLLGFARQAVDRPLDVLRRQVGSEERPAPWCGAPGKPVPCRGTSRSAP